MKKMKIGIDLGNGYTKFRGQIFASKVKTGRMANFGERRDGVYEVFKDGVWYTVGDGTNFIIPNRYKSNLYKIALLTAIALASEQNEKVVDVDLCIGVPVDKFLNAKYVLDMKEELLSYKQEKIAVDGKDMIITIKKVQVFPEGAYVIKTKDTSRVLTIDIGAGTVNLVEWKNQRVVNQKTLQNSFKNLYQKIAQNIQATSRGTVSVDYIEENFGKDCITIGQKTVDISDTRNIITEHITELASEIGTLFPVEEMDKIQILGGGAVPTFESFKEIYPEAELVENSQFINSEIFDMVAGVMK